MIGFSTSPARRAGTTRTARLGVVLAGLGLLLAACGGTPATAGPATTAPTTPPSVPATDPVTPPSQAATTAPPTADPGRARALVTSAMLPAKVVRSLGLKPSIEEPVGPSTQWWLACESGDASAHGQLAGGYQQWKASGRTAVLETVTLYPPGLARTALDERVAAARSCTTYRVGGLELRVLSVDAAAGSATVCSQTPNNVLCSRAEVRGDLVATVAAFRPTRKQAKALAGTVAGLSAGLSTRATP